jgi:hypothetical protein
MKTPKRKTKAKMGTTRCDTDRSTNMRGNRSFGRTDGEALLLGDPHEVGREGGKNVALK